MANYAAIYWLLAYSVRSLSVVRGYLGVLLASGVGVSLLGLGAAIGTFPYKDAFVGGRIYCQPPVPEQHGSFPDDDQPVRALPVGRIPQQGPGRPADGCQLPDLPDHPGHRIEGRPAGLSGRAGDHDARPVRAATVAGPGLFWRASGRLRGGHRRGDGAHRRQDAASGLALGAGGSGAGLPDLPGLAVYRLQPAAQHRAPGAACSPGSSRQRRCWWWWSWRRPASASGTSAGRWRRSPPRRTRRP